MIQDHYKWKSLRIITGSPEPVLFYDTGKTYPKYDMPTFLAQFLKEIEIRDDIFENVLTLRQQAYDVRCYLSDAAAYYALATYARNLNVWIRPQLYNYVTSGLLVEEFTHKPLVFHDLVQEGADNRNWRYRNQ